MDHSHALFVSASQKFRIEICFYDVFCCFYSYDSCAKRNDIRVVVLLDQMRGRHIRAHCRTHAFYLVGSDGDSNTIGDALKFVKENEMCKVCSHNGNVFAVEPPLFVELQITETEPGFKGDTATGATKPATVETGATVSVPLFVEQDDVIKIDTRTGEYLSRV